jgi:hypothetical protein
MPRNLELTLVDEENLERIARIMGEGSASAQALAEAKRRREFEKDIVIYETNDRTLVVGPRIVEENADGEDANGEDSPEGAE